MHIELADSLRNGFIAGATVLLGILVQEWLSRIRKRTDTARDLTNETMNLIAKLTVYANDMKSPNSSKVSFGSEWWEIQFDLKSRLRLLEVSVRWPMKKANEVGITARELLARSGIIESELSQGRTVSRTDLEEIIAKAQLLYSLVFGDGREIREIAYRIVNERNSGIGGSSLSGNPK